MSITRAERTTEKGFVAQLARTGARALVMLGLALIASAAAEDLRVEDWSEQTIGAKGVPLGWTRYETIGGRPAYDFTIVEDEGRRALFLKSSNEHSTIAKEIKVNLRSTPILEWSWKVIRLPAGADIRTKETSDLTAHIYVIWPRFPAMVRARLIGYVWDASAPAQTIEKSRKTGTVHFFVLRSGPVQLNQWLTERRNVYEDYRRVFGEDPEDPPAIALSIDTNDTHSTAEALIGRISFTSPSGSAQSSP
jgi:Protein of unknown function (DUF3047).